MANTLTNLIPTIYKAADTVLRELTGFIPASTFDASGEGVAKNQTIAWPVVPAGAAVDIAPAAYGPTVSDTTVGNDTMTISKSKGVPFYWTGEDQLGLGGLYDKILQDQFAQAMRILVNEVDADLAALYIYASRAYGTAGVLPFASDLTDIAQVRKILADNGAPLGDLQMVINTSAGAKMRSLTPLSFANQAGSDALLRQGILSDLMGFAIRESAQVKVHTPTGATGTLVDLTAGYAIGKTTIHVDTVTGTWVAGDILTNTKTGRDTNKYVVATGLAAAEGDLVIAKPGLQVAAVNNDPLAAGAAYTANMAFSKSAIHLLLRTPAMPEGGDAADDVTVITDPQTGISFQVAMYRQYRRVTFEVGLAWGVKAVKPEAIAILLG